MPDSTINHCLDNIIPVFPDRQNGGLNISEDLRTLEGAEGSRDFHVQLHHAQFPFGMIVCEGNCRVHEEPQELITIVTQADQKVMACLLGFSVSPAKASSHWVSSFMEGEYMGHLRDRDVCALKTRDPCKTGGQLV